jgi:multiple antibiotic resistance protein
VPELAAYLKIAVALFVLVNPLEGVPIFLARTRLLAEEARLRIARTAAASVTIIMLTSLVVGRWLLATLGISIGAFQVAGGVLILLIGIQMVLGEPHESKPSEDERPIGNFAIVPLAIPLLAGPGVIGTVIIYSTRGPLGGGASLRGDLILCAILVGVGLATWGALRAGDPLRRILGDTGIDVATRVSGLIVAAIAVEMMRDGLLGLFPRLGG